MMILGLDPGSTTGAVVLNTLVGVERPIEQPGADYLIVEYDQVEFPEMPAYLEYRLPQVDLVAAEQYVITAKTATLTRQYAALYVLGGAMFLADLNGVRFKLQKPTDAKTAFSDAVLRDMNLWGKVAGDHARDALRHALLAARLVDTGVYKDPEPC